MMRAFWVFACIFFVYLIIVKGSEILTFIVKGQKLIIFKGVAKWFQNSPTLLMVKIL